MKKCTIIYEPSLDGYSLKFDYDANALNFLKKVIPSHLRTSSGPPDWYWYFGRDFFEVVKTLFEGLQDKYKRKMYEVRVVSEVEVKKLQEEQANASHSWTPSTRSVSIDEELHKFYDLVPHNGTSFDVVRNMSLDEAKKLYRKGANVYHPDRNNGSPSAASKMCELNEVWSLLKEIYYLK